MSQSNDVIGDVIGDWGRWQFRSVILIYLCKIPSAWFMACVIFTAPTPNPGEFYCQGSETNLITDKNVWIQQMHPHVTQDEVYNIDFCSTYNLTHNHNNSYSVEYGKDILVPCTSFKFDSNFESAVTKFSLVCSRSILIAFAQFSHLFGVLTGGILAKLLMRTISPRNLMLYGMLSQIVTGCSAGLVPHDYGHLMLFRYLAAACCAQMYTAGQVLCTDITGGKHRTITVCLFEVFWSIGIILLPVIAYIDPNWSRIFVMISLPTVLYIPLWFFWIPNSPRWLLKSGHIDEVVKILENAAYVNNRCELIRNDLRQRLYTQMKLDIKEPPPAEWLSLWTGHRNIGYILAVHIAWATFVTSFNGMLLNVKAFGREYVPVNTFVFGLSEIIGVLIGLFLVLKTVRKWKYSGAFNIIAGVIASLGFFLPHSLSSDMKVSLLMLTAIIPKIAVSCSLSVLLTSTTELVEPDKRAALVFSCIVGARIVLLTAPFIGALTAIHEVLALSVYGALNVIGGIATAIISTPKIVQKRHSNPVILSKTIFSIEFPNAFYLNSGIHLVNSHPAGSSRNHF